MEGGRWFLASGYVYTQQRPIWLACALPQSYRTEVNWFGPPLGDARSRGSETTIEYGRRERRGPS